MGAFFSKEDEEDDNGKLGLKKDLDDNDNDKEKDLFEEPIIKSSKRNKTRSKRKSGGKTKRYKYY
jgi:hypothetical protein